MLPAQRGHGSWRLEVHRLFSESIHHHNHFDNAQRSCVLISPSGRAIVADLGLTI